jgi:hypothetical protein
MHRSGITQQNGVRNRLVMKHISVGDREATAGAITAVKKRDD